MLQLKPLFGEVLLELLLHFFMYIPRKIMTFKEFMDNFTKGMQQMITSGCILMLAWTIGGVCRVFT